MLGLRLRRVALSQLQYELVLPVEDLGCFFPDLPAGTEQIWLRVVVVIDDDIVFIARREFRPRVLYYYEKNESIFIALFLTFNQIRPS